MAFHFHDTHGLALLNVLKAVQMGIRSFDSSVGGLGGCPYAKKQVGNVCSENLVCVLEKVGLDTGVNMEKLKEVGDKYKRIFHKDTEIFY